MSEPTNDPFFIVGADRSGTTLLRLMLNEHPRLHVPRESYFIRDLVLDLPTDRVLSPEEAEEAVRIIKHHPRWPDWEISDAELDAAVDRAGLLWLRDIVERVFRISRERDEKRRWGDKTPMYIHQLDRIHLLFPEAKIIHLVRDGRDVTVSLRRVSWHGTTTLANAMYWTRTVGRGLRLGRPLGAQYREFRYEDLVLEPRETLEAVCNFLGERFHPQMLRFYEEAAGEIAPWEKTLHTKVVRPPRESDVERWKREMSPLQIGVVEAIGGRVMDELGQPRHFTRGGRLLTASAALPLTLIWKALKVKRDRGIALPGWMRRGWRAMTGDTQESATPKA